MGIISNVYFSSPTANLRPPRRSNDWDELKDRIRQGLMLTAITMMPLSAIMIALSLPIVRVVYERGAFGTDDSRLVSAVLVAASLGSLYF